MSPSFSHIDERGNPSMVNVGHKPPVIRRARAEGRVVFPPELMDTLLKEHLHTVKGPVIQTAITAAIMGAKRTGDLIPLCHPLGLDHLQVEIIPGAHQDLIIEASAEVCGRTGVEMEALMAVSIAALTIYDMCKSLSHDIRITDIRLMEKTGGKRDFKREADGQT